MGNRLIVLCAPGERRKLVFPSRSRKSITSIVQGSIVKSIGSLDRKLLFSSYVFAQLSKTQFNRRAEKNYQSSVVMISGFPPTPPEADLTRWFNFVALRPSTRRNNDSHSGWRVNVNHNYFLEAINHFHWPFHLFLRFAAGALARHRSRWKKTEKEVFGQWKKEKIESKNEMIIISLWTFYNQLIFICALRKWKIKQNRELWHSKNLWRALPPESGLAELHIIDTFIT